MITTRPNFGMAAFQARAVVSLVIAAPGYVALNIKAVTYEVEGNLRRTVYNVKNGVPFEVQEFSFDASVSNAVWNIKTRYGKNDWTELACDGKDVFQVLYDPDQKPQRGMLFSRPASVTMGTYPAIADPFTATIWLALASGQYTSTLGPEGAMPAPWTMPVADPLACIFNAKGIYAEKTHLPSELTFIVAADLLKAAPTNALFAGVIDEHMSGWLREYSAGFVAGHLSVSKATNVASITLPREFELIRYATPKGEVCERYEGTITAVSAQPKTVNRPAIQQAVGVSDFRFRDMSAGVGSISYLITNGQWLSAQDDRLKSLFETKRSTSAAYSYPISSPRSAIPARLLFLALALVPIGAWIAIRMRASGSGNKS